MGTTCVRRRHFRLPLLLYCFESKFNCMPFSMLFFSLLFFRFRFLFLLYYGQHVHLFVVICPIAAHEPIHSACLCVCVLCTMYCVCARATCNRTRNEILVHIIYRTTSTPSMYKMFHGMRMLVSVACVNENTFTVCVLAVSSLFFLCFVLVIFF